MMSDNSTRDNKPTAGQPQIVWVAAEHDGWRLDKMLAETLPELSRTRLKTIIQDGGVSAEGAALCDPAQRVQPGQRLEIRLPELRDADPIPQAIDLTIVYEDRHLLVLDKPAGLVVHPAAGNLDGTLVNALLAHCGEQLSGIGGVRRPGIVHRLDKDTSGLMVVAKDDATHRGLAEQFAAHSLERAYRALVWGVPSPRQGELTGAIGRSPRNRKKMAVVTRGGKTALTTYRVEHLVGTQACQVECRLSTGRTHQIRVHMATLGHPVIGDPLYGKARAQKYSILQKTDAAVHLKKGQALHAYLLGFIHPYNQQFLRFESDLPIYYKELADTLRQI